MSAYHQVVDPVSHNLTASALIAALPLLAIFVLLGVVKMKSHWAGLLSLLVALVVAVWAYDMPVGQGLDATAEGAVFGLFAIMWIVINAIWIYTMTVATGLFDVLRRSFGSVSDDQRVQAIIIAFCFGALLEALAGFGTPVAITSVMLIALGFEPMKAASVALVANTAPVAYGAIAIPITTLADITGLPVDDLGATVGRQTPVLSLFVPLALVFIVDGRRGVRQAWLPAGVGGLVFAIGQFLCSNYFSVQLTDIAASLLSALAIVVLMRVWTPSTVVRGEVDDSPSHSAGSSALQDDDTRGRVFQAYLPYLIVIAVFGLAQQSTIKAALAHGTKVFSWPGLNILSSSGQAPSSQTFTFNWLPAGGTLLLIAGVLTVLALRITPLTALQSYGRTLRQLAFATLTVVAVLALAYVMNLSGQTISIAKWMAAAGGAFALLSPVLGWIGVAVTGSDTSSNALFGGLQVSAAKDAGLPQLLLAAANSSGGVLGKMISPQNLAIAAAAVGLGGREGELFRKVFGWSVLFVSFMAVLVYLQSTVVLSWMLP